MVKVFFKFYTFFSVFKFNYLMAFPNYYVLLLLKKEVELIFVNKDLLC